MESFEFLVLSGVFVTGLTGTVVYYFARFYLFKDEASGTSASESKLEASAQKPQAQSVSLSDSLLKSKKSFWSKPSEETTEVSSMNELEEALYLADLGPQTVHHLIEKAQGDLDPKSGFKIEDVKQSFKKNMLEIFKENDSEGIWKRTLSAPTEGGPYVISIVGVNGAGKTTTIGKLANKYLREGKKVMVAAGDTFRAAAENQLGVWAERSEALIFKAPAQTKDPGAVAFQAYEKAKKEGVDILLIDTAGRLHTQDNLMRELEKVAKVLKKQSEEAPHEVWMVVDSNTGMNAFYQAESFHKSLGVTAVIMTKVDGSAKAGTALGLKHALDLPILMLGVGEQIEDLQLFKSDSFVESLV